MRLNTNLMLLKIGNTLLVYLVILSPLVLATRLVTRLLTLPYQE